MTGGRNLLVSLVIVGATVSAALAFSGGALAYGRADQPVAQVEVSGNCTNPTWCATHPADNPFGTGGFWIWAELDSAGGVNTVDATFAGCGHTVGGGGPGSAGGGGGPVQGTWTTASNLFQAAIVDGAFPVGIALDANGNPDLSNVPYYEITLPSPFGPFSYAVPVPVGHYNYSGLQFISGVPVEMHIPGVNFQTQVAR